VAGQCSPARVFRSVPRQAASLSVMADRLTLDTNVLLEYWKEQAKRSVTERLLDLACAGRVELMVIARIRDDVPLEPLVGEINRLDELGVAEGPSVARLGSWVLGRDMLGSDAFVDAETELSAAMEARGHKPPDWRDWDHIHSHFLQNRDVYLTWDERVLDVSDALRERFGVAVMPPEEYLALRT
jgi:hypothetical protein